MRALIVGYGSIGQRHAEVLKNMGLDVAVVSRREIDGIARYPDLATGLDNWAPGYVVIASRTSEHLGDLKVLAACGYDGILLVEKPPLNDSATLPPGLPDKSFAAFNLRFHPAVQALRDALRGEPAFSMNAYVGQYLPDWRPGTDYRQSYSAQKEVGGGVLRDLSHEIDLANWLFGPWRQLTAAGGQLSNLEIDSDDVFSLIIEMESCPVAAISMNYLDKQVTRGMTVHTEAGTFKIDLVNAIFTANEKSERYDVGRNDTYIAEHHAILNDRTDMLCRLDQSADVMGMILAAESASRDRIWIKK
jgi:hypothetical protein